MKISTKCLIFVQFSTRNDSFFEIYRNTRVECTQLFYKFIRHFERRIIIGIAKEQFKDTHEKIFVPDLFLSCWAYWIAIMFVTLLTQKLHSRFQHSGADEKTSSAERNEKN